MKKKYKNKISFQLTLYIIISIGVFLLIAITLISLFLDRFYENQKHSVENKLTTLFISLITPSLERYDYYGVEKNCQKFLSEEVVSYVYIYDDSGFLINQSYREKFSGLSVFIDEVNIPIISDNKQKIGEAKIGYNFSTFFYSQLKIKIALFLTIVVLLFSISFTIIFIISKNLSNPLEQLLFSINKITSGDYSYRLEVNSNDEIGDISSAFNSMTVKLNSVISLINGIVDNLPNAIILINKEFRVSLWNKMAEKLFFVESNLCLNKLIYEVDSYFIEIENEISSVINKLEPKVIEQKVIELDKWKDKIHTISLIPLFSMDYENNLEGIIIKIDDETENVKKVDMINKMQRMESIQHLGAGIAHDFNNILGTITGTISLMDNDIKNENKISKEELEEYIDILKLTTQKASLVVNQLSSLTKKNETRFSIVDLTKCIENVIKICEHSFDKSVEISFNSDPEINLYIYGSETQIEQAILNLCINSYHAMTIMKKENEKKGGQLLISINKLEKDNKEYAYVSIKDNGVGIPKENLNKIFDPFFSTKEKATSSGLGLTMVYNIVESHKGFIEVISEVEIGTEIKLYFPIYKKIENEGLIEEEKISINKKFKGKRAIIIDDEDNLRKVLQQILEKVDFNVYEVKDPQNFIETYETYKNEISLIILDLIMPKISGYELYKILEEKYNIKNKDIPVILTTGLSNDERVLELSREKNIYFLFKPYSMEDLIKILNKIF
ncbi:MAG: response regulator [Spirochaetales bacterium]|nr:response regulator [Spirochaetales bacterium]